MRCGGLLDEAGGGVRKYCLLQPPPATRQELDRFYQDLNAPRQAVAAPVRSPARPTPAYLPPGRQERMADVLQASPVRETVARRPQQR